MIAPTDKVQLIAPLKKAHDAGIPIVCVDTFIGTGVFRRVPATRTFRFPTSLRQRARRSDGGARAGSSHRRKGKVYVSNVKPGISTTDQREEGFKDEMKKYSGVQVLETQFNDDDANKAAAQVQAVFGRTPDLAGVFGANLFSATAPPMASPRRARPARSNRRLRCTGIDGGPAQDGTFTLTIAQHPAEIGYFGYITPSPMSRTIQFRPHRHWLYGDDRRQYRRSEGLRVSLQEQMSMWLSKLAAIHSWWRPFS